MSKPPISMKLVEVIMLERGEAEKRKRIFNKAFKKEFKDFAEKISGRKLKGYDLHHPIPTHLNGCVRNVVAVKPKRHKRIEWIINQQIRGMRPGDKRKILIPYQDGPVWR